MDFTVSDRLDDRSKDVLLELAKHGTIGSPAHEVQTRLDEDTE